MNRSEFLNVEDLFAIYSAFSTEDLEKEKKELLQALSDMVANPEIVPRLAMVSSLLDEREDEING